MAYKGATAVKRMPFTATLRQYEMNWGRRAGRDCTRCRACMKAERRVAHTKRELAKKRREEREEGEGKEEREEKHRNSAGRDKGSYHTS
jgi:hypothetical protein